MLAFTIVWIGQLVSLLGSNMTWFAFTIWAWRTTGEATALTLVEFFLLVPTFLLGPVAGALVDRWNRKLVMIFSDMVAALSTVVVLLLHATGSLQMWHLYVIGACAGAFGAFQFPAYSAAVTMMVPKEQYTRANGMTELAESAIDVAAPLLAAVLLGLIGLTGIMIIDVATFGVALGTLLLVRIPQPSITKAGRKGQGSIWREALYGFRYILERPSLLGLELMFAGSNLLDSLSFALLAPMVLARTGNDQVVLGSVQSAGAVGAIVGGILLVVWGGPKRKIHGVLIGCVLSSLLGTSMMGLGATFVVWALANFFSDFFTPTIDGSDEGIWQTKVAPDVQGRVFATRPLFSEAVVLVGMLLAGPLADHVFEPAMMSGGGLATAFGWLVGTGPGSGMAFVFMLAGLLGALISLGGYAFRVVRNIEDVLPDYDQET